MSIVDQSQFRNLAVGSGYQAPFVVRQPTAPTARAVVVDESATQDRPSKKAKKEKKKHKKHKKHHKKHSKHATRDDDGDDDESDGAPVNDGQEPIEAAARQQARVDEAAVSAAGPRIPDEWEMPRRLARFEALLEERLAKTTK